jgi:hypothetical protein
MQIILWILKLMIAALPGVMLNLPIWAVILIVGSLTTLPIPFGAEIYWIVGLIGAFCGPQDGFAITYYILTILPVITTIIYITTTKRN